MEYLYGEPDKYHGIYIDAEKYFEYFINTNSVPNDDCMKLKLLNNDITLKLKSNIGTTETITGKLFDLCKVTTKENKVEIEHKENDIINILLPKPDINKLSYKPEYYKNHIKEFYEELFKGEACHLYEPITDFDTIHKEWYLRISSLNFNDLDFTFKDYNYSMSFHYNKYKGNLNNTIQIVKWKEESKYHA